MPAAAAAAIALFPVQSSALAAAGAHTDPTIRLERGSLEWTPLPPHLDAGILPGASRAWMPELLLELDGLVSTPGWSLRLGLAAGWTMTGILCASSQATSLLPLPVLALAGWILFEISVEAGRDLALRANMAVMALFWVTTTSLTPDPVETDTLDPGFHDDVMTRGIIWHSLLSPLMTAPVEILTSWLWHHTHPDRARRFKVALSPVIHAGEITGASLGFFLIL